MQVAALAGTPATLDPRSAGRADGLQNQLDPRASSCWSEPEVAIEKAARHSGDHNRLRSRPAVRPSRLHRNAAASRLQRSPTGSGPIDLTGLNFAGDTVEPGLMEAATALIVTGPADFPATSRYQGFTGPTSFGSGGLKFANSGSGDVVGIGEGFLWVPEGYFSGTALSDSSTYNNATFSSLGVTPGTYEWTWGTGANQNFTLVIPASAVPDSGSTFVLLVLALGALVGANRLRPLRLA